MLLIEAHSIFTMFGKILSNWMTPITVFGYFLSRWIPSLDTYYPFSYGKMT
jgi:hypothetical protein